MYLFIKNTSGYRARRRAWVFISPVVLFSVLLHCGLLCSSVFAQDYNAEPQPQRFTSSASAARGQVQHPLQQQRFMLGFNWGEIPQDSNAFKQLRIAVLHEGLWESANPSSQSYQELRRYYPYGLGFIHADNELSHGGQPYPYAWAMSMQYDPVVGRRGDEYNFLPRYKDTTGAVWGFAQRDLAVGDVLDEDPTNTDNPNYNRMVLRDTNLRRTNLQESLPAAAPRLVLSDPRPNVLQLPDDIDDVRANYTKWTKHADSLQVFASNQMFLRDHRIGYKPFRLTVYQRDSITNAIVYDSAGNAKTTQVVGPEWIDTTFRASHETIMHMKGDSSEWYIAANLRRMPIEAQLSVPSNTPVLSIRVPFTVRYDTVSYDSNGVRTEKKGTTTSVVYARFDSTAAVGSSVVEHNWYGAMDNALAAASNDTTFVIRAGMIPSYEHLIGNQIRPDITLSAHFWLPKFEKNDRYKNYLPSRVVLEAPPSGGDGSAVIVVPQPPRTIIVPVVLYTHMEVRYHGNVDIGLDWLRFESRLTRLILRGYKDSLITQRAQKWYNYLDTAGTNRGFWLYGHYMADESSPAFWAVHRQMNNLLEARGTTETGPFWRGHYAHQTQDKQQWVAWMNFSYNHAAPFIRYGFGGRKSDAPTALWAERKDRSMGLGNGYRGIRFHQGTADSIEYRDVETFRKPYAAPDPKSGPLYNMPDSLYHIVINESPSVQANIEHALWENALFIPEFLYGRLPVWYNSWTYSEWKTDDNPYNSDNASRPKAAYSSFTRPVTGEETRLMNWLALALGGKGLMPYKGGSSFNTTDDGQKKWEYGMSCYPSADGKTGRLNNAGQNTGTLGGDFLDNSHTIWPYINVDSSAAFMGIQTNRFYIGSASPMKQTILAHSFADDNSAELMRLQLQAVYSKGFKLVATQRDTSVHLERFVDTSATTTTSKFHVRRLHTRTGAAWTGGDEHFRDSTFFLLTLLKDSAKSMDEVFYLGVVNRRTDPTVYYPQAGGTDLDSNIKFFSTLEFDSLVTGGYLNSQYSKPAYAQAGARQITLPFNYQSPKGYALLRVQELGGTLDTILGQDANLALVLKPGEGKIFRVKVLSPGTVPEGELAYNGQRKMVVVPTLDNKEEVRYHIVYHRNVGGKRQVFYRRSQSTPLLSDEANIVWEPEIPLSGWVQEYFPTERLLKYPDCAYPSLVVRPDKDGRLLVYPVFTCTDPTDSYNALLVENRFEADASTTDQLAQTATAVSLTRITSEDINRYGTPVVSACKDFNIYAWSDEEFGIGIAFKEATAPALQGIDYIHWARFPELQCQHPSLTSYTAPNNNEHTSSLVWQEEDGHIYYSIVGISNGALQLLKLPFPTLRLNADSTIARLSDTVCTTNNRLPVIYRSVENNRLPFSYAPMTMERVLWEGKSRYGDAQDRWKLFHRKLDLFAVQPPRAGVLDVSAINQFFAFNGSLFQPNVAQGVARMRWQNDLLNISDSAFVLNAIYSTNNSEAATDATVLHMPLNYWSRFLSDATNLPYTGKALSSSGRYVHLAAAPTAAAVTPALGQWQTFRRIFEYGNTPSILSHPQYFYRTAKQAFDMTFVLDVKKDCAKLMVFDPWVNGDALVWKIQEPRFGGTPQHPVVQMYPDTVFSTWFPIGSSAEVSFYVMGTATGLAKVDLVKKSDGTRQTIALPLATDTTARLLKQVYTNGGGELYRLEFVKTDASAVYAEDVIIGPIPLSDASGNPVGYAKGGIEREVERGQVQNLALGGTGEQAGLHAYAYPNPARETVRLSLYRVYGESEAVTGTSSVEQLEVRILTALGKEVARYRAKVGEVLELSVREFPAGAYFVRVESLSGNTNGTSTEYGTTSFVVER